MKNMESIRNSRFIINGLELCGVHPHLIESFSDDSKEHVLKLTINSTESLPITKIVDYFFIRVPERGNGADITITVTWLDATGCDLYQIEYKNITFIDFGDFMGDYSNDGVQTFDVSFTYSDRYISTPNNTNEKDGE